MKKAVYISLFISVAISISMNGCDDGAQSDFLSSSSSVFVSSSEIESSLSNESLSSSNNVSSLINTSSSLPQSSSNTIENINGSYEMLLYPDSLEVDYGDDIRIENQKIVGKWFFTNNLLIEVNG